MNLLFEEPIASMLTAQVHVFSRSRFFFPFFFKEKYAEYGMKSDRCKNRNDIAGRSIVIGDWART